MRVEPDRPLTVATLTQRIGLALEDFGPVLVQGELSQVKVAPSGHLYATLKDSAAVIGLVMWRSAVVRNGALPREGEQVLVRGALSVYGPRGQYQLVATRITAQGQGDLAARFEALKARLEAAGLFADERKLPLPLLPRAVGIATATGSAALADLLHSIRARFPAMPVVIAPCLVQGAAAAGQIAAAIGRLDLHPLVDVIVVARGGGSIEDLWAFNEELVVRALAACTTPIVSAVGHETDTTLADFAADLRAKTPTAAGELVVPVAAELRQLCRDGEARLGELKDGMVAAMRGHLAGLAKHRALAGPGHQLALRRQRLDEQHARLDAVMAGSLEDGRARLRLAQARLGAVSPARRIASARDQLVAATRQLRAAALRRVERGAERLATAAGRLDALSPLAVIARGYSVVRSDAGLLVRRLDQAPPGSTIDIRVSDGRLRAQVLTTQPQRLNEPSAGYDAS